MLPQISEIKNHVTTSEFLLACRVLDLTLAECLYMMLLFHSRSFLKKSIQNMDFSKVFLMDLYLREQYKSRHASITCIQFHKTIPTSESQKAFPWQVWQMWNCHREGTSKRQQSQNQFSLWSEFVPTLWNIWIWVCCFYSPKWPFLIRIVKLV